MWAEVEEIAAAHCSKLIRMHVATGGFRNTPATVSPCGVVHLQVPTISPDIPNNRAKATTFASPGGS